MSSAAARPVRPALPVRPVRLVRVALDDWRLAPEQALLLVRDDPHPFALVGAWGGGGAVVGSAPVRVAGAQEDPFALLDEQPAAVEAAGAAGAAGAVGGGWVGALGYALGGLVERVAPAPPRVVALPAAPLAFHDHVLRLDPAGRWWFEALETPERADALRARLDELRARAAAAQAPAPRPFSTAPWRSVPSPAGHARAVAAAVERIAAGDLFQANLTLRLESRLDGEAVDLFAHACAALRAGDGVPAHAAFLAGPWGALASLSPELLLRRAGRGRAVVSSPIKGTGATRAALAASGKDQAEHVMIVDLVRNDLGRVCVPGSVRVARLAEPRRGPGVWHLVSDVAGELREGVGDAELVRAAFPPGSVTGAPKVAALDVISELESSAREHYTGAIGLASPLAGLELSVAIRTFETDGERIWLGAGGGVVAESDPAAEAEEAAAKARPLLDAIGARAAPAPAPAPAAPVPPAPVPLRLGPRPLPRPDPAAGVFTTFLPGADPAPHLARLARSARALYGVGLPPELRGRLDELVRTRGLSPESHPGAVRTRGLSPESHRVRVLVDPDGSVRVDVVPLGPPLPQPVVLVPVTLPGGLGAHKWQDRQLLEALEVDLAPAFPLLVDLDGAVLESSRWSVVAERADGALVTPPADGRILPGVTVAAMPDVTPASLALADLRAARGLRLASAGGVRAAVLA